jgi:hypothetical protein
MEDTYALCPNICELPMSPMSHEYADKLPHRIAVQFETHRQQSGGGCGGGGGAAAAAAGAAAAAHRAHSVGGSAGSPQHSLEHRARSPPVAEQLQQRPSPAPADATACDEPTAATFAGAAALPLAAAVPADGEQSVGSMSSGGSDPGVCIEKLHFFGVYDGHGGIEASQHCAQRLHYHLSRAVAEMASIWLMNNTGEDVAPSWDPEVRLEGVSLAVCVRVRVRCG